MYPDGGNEVQILIHCIRLCPILRDRGNKFFDILGIRVVKVVEGNFYIEFFKANKGVWWMPWL